MGPKTRAKRRGEVNLLAARLARTLGEPAPSPKRRGHRDAFDGVDDTRASWDMATASFANSAAPSPIAPLGGLRKPPSTNAPLQPATPAGSASGREGGDRAWGPALAGSANPSPSKANPHPWPMPDANRQNQIQNQNERRLSAESARSARTQEDPHVLSQPNDFEASSPLREGGLLERNGRNGSDDDGDAAGESNPSNAELRERLRRAEASIRSMRVKLEDVAERARMDALTRESAEATAADLERTLAKFATQNEEMLAAVKRQTNRAIDAEQKAKIAERAVGETRLSDARRLEVAMKAGYLARYWRSAFALGVAPGGGGGCMAREAATWSARAPAGGVDALVGLMRRVAREGGAHSEHQSVTPVAKEFFAGREYGGADADGGADGSGQRWRPSTLADAIDVEIGLRVMRDARVEEAVLVALADRRRALAERTCGDVGSVSVSGTSGPGGRSGDWITLSEAEEAEVAYRRAWLAFLWWRARGARVEPGVCEGRCEEWFRRVAGTTPTFDAAREALEVEEGLRELRELGVEAQLWRRSGPSPAGERRLSRGPGLVPGG